METPAFGSAQKAHVRQVEITRPGTDPFSDTNLTKQKNFRGI
jgi:hypothetical protein